MEKIILSYRFTGEDPNHLNDVLGNIDSKLKTRGYDVFCSFFLEDFFKSQNMGPDEIYAHCLKEQESCDIFMPLIKSEHPSSGMKMELEKALDFGQKNILLIRRDLEFPQFRAVAQQTIEYDSLPDLYRRLEEESFNF